jgi:hypothetical protein
MTPDPERVAVFAEWLLAGMRISQIPAQVAKHNQAQAEKKQPTWPPMDSDELAATLDAAHEQLLLDTRIDLKRETSIAIARMNMLFTRSIATQDYKGAAGIQRELNALIFRAANPLGGIADDAPAQACAESTGEGGPDVIPVGRPTEGEGADTWPNPGPSRPRPRRRS